MQTCSCTKQQQSTHISNVTHYKESSVTLISSQIHSYLCKGNDGLVKYEIHIVVLHQEYNTEQISLADYSAAIGNLDTRTHC
jgi:hypothetical protein